MSDDCTCARCQGDGHYDEAQWAAEMKRIAVPLVDRQAAAIAELVARFAWKAEADEVLERHGLR